LLNTDKPDNLISETKLNKNLNKGTTMKNLLLLLAMISTLNAFSGTLEADTDVLNCIDELTYQYTNEGALDGVTALEFIAMEKECREEFKK